jgi:PBP1b-binding outer membrane lipoprotein LpoB
MMRRTKFTQLIGCLLLFYLIILGGCGSKPITSGSQSDVPYAGTRAVVWGSHSGAVGEVVTNLQKMKLKIVERAHLRQVFDEQKITLSDSPDDEGNVLKVGKIVGADIIVFVDVQTSSDVVSSAGAYKYYASSQTSTRYHLSVSVRSVSVETGEVIWSGTAHYGRGINNPEAGIIYLTRSAFVRGICPQGAWSDMSGTCDFKKAYGSGATGMYLGHKNSATGKQLVITGFAPGSSAQQAGLKVGDIILSCDGKTGMQTLLELMTNCKKEAGEQITYEILRGDKNMKITATAVPRFAK